MKNSTIKSAKQLPSWFKLENYEKAKYFGAGEWYDELMPRLYLRLCWERFKKNPLDIPQNWDFIKQKGLLFHVAKDEETKFRIRSITPDFHEVKKVADKPAQMSVSSLTNFNMYGGCYWYSEEDEQKKIEEKINVLLGEEFKTTSEDLKVEAMTWIVQPFTDCPMDVFVGLKNKYAYAKVDLEASDEQLKSDFSVWLASERKRRECPAPKKNFSDADMDGWYESAVLPYLDLMFWSEIEKTKITQHVIAQAIFLDAYSLESDTDPLGRLKTTKKKADYLMDQKIMKLLELQITE